jgi:hypothetical protein
MSPQLSVAQQVQQTNLNPLLNSPSGAPIPLQLQSVMPVMSGRQSSLMSPQLSVAQQVQQTNLNPLLNSPSGAPIPLQLQSVMPVTSRPQSSLILLATQPVTYVGVGTLGLRVIDDVPKQRILLMNLYLNQILNTIMLNNVLKKNHEKKSTTIFDNLTIISKYNNINADYMFRLPDFSVPSKYDENYSKIISKVNTLLDKNHKLTPLSACSSIISGGKRKNNSKYYYSKNYLKKRKQNTIKKKIRNIKIKKSLKSKIKNKMNKKIKKYVKKCIKNNIKKQQQEKQQRQQHIKNKCKIKKILESKIHEKINKLKLNKTRNLNKSKNNYRTYTRKNY